MWIAGEYLLLTQQHKLEDMSFVWMDGVQPEYYISDNEIFLRDKSASEKVAKMLLTLFGTLTGVSILIKIFVSYRVLANKRFKKRRRCLGMRPRSSSKELRRPKKIGECIRLSPTIPLESVPHE